MKDFLFDIVMIPIMIVGFIIALISIFTSDKK